VKLFYHSTGTMYHVQQSKDHCPLSEGNRPLKLSNWIRIIRILFDKCPERVREILSFLILLIVLYIRLNFDVII